MTKSTTTKRAAIQRPAKASKRASTAAAAADHTNPQADAAEASTADPVVAAVASALANYTKPAQVEQLGPLEPVAVPSRMLAAALLAAAKGDARAYLNSVQISRAGKKAIRLAASNGHVLLVAQVESQNELPVWLTEAGVLVDREHLPTVLKLTGTKDGDEVTLSYGANHPHLVADIGTWASLKLARVDGRFPDIAKVIEGGADALTHENAVPMEAAGLDPKYVQMAAQIATTLGAGNVRAFAAHTTGASVFTFAGLPAALYVMPMREAAELPTTAVAILAPAVRRSMAALKAHETRLLVAAEEKPGDEGEELRTRAAAFTARIKALAAASGSRALAGPKAEKAPKAEKSKPGRKPRATPADEQAPTEPVSDDEVPATEEAATVH